MRRASNAVALAEEAELESAPVGGNGAHPNESDGDRDGAVAAVVRDAKRLVDDLSHDVRQPLSSINMNVESAIRCLQLPEPRVASALQALTDCLAPESELLAMVDGVQRHLTNTLAEYHSHPLHERARDHHERLIAVECTDTQQVAARCEDASRHVRVASALRTALVAIAGSILALARTNANASRSVAASVRIETRRVSGRSQLLLCDLRCESAQDIHFLRQCVATAVRHLPGKVSLELGPTTAVIVISLPTRIAARRPILVRGNHGA